MVLLYLILFPPSSDLSQFSYTMFRLNLLWPSWMLSQSPLASGVAQAVPQFCLYLQVLHDLPLQAEL